MRVIAGLAALLTALCMATGALAHAALVSTDPADGSILTQSPKTLQLLFPNDLDRQNRTPDGRVPCGRRRLHERGTQSADIHAHNVQDRC